MHHSKAPATAPQLIRATRSNVEEFEAWVNSQRASGGNGAEAATIAAALDLKPDAIFFLSDGGFDPRTADLVREDNKRPTVPINTIGFEDRSRERLLQQMADDSGGKYRFVP